MELKHHIKNGIVILDIEGDVLPQYLAEAKNYVQPFRKDNSIKGLVLNFAKVGFVDAAGVAFFATMVKVFYRSNSRVVVCNLDKKNQMLFDIVNLDKVLRIFATEKEAIDSFTPNPADEL